MEERDVTIWDESSVENESVLMTTKTVLRTYVRFGIVVVAVVFIILTYLFGTRLQTSSTVQNQTSGTNDNQTDNTHSSQNVVVVDVKGDVRRPGLYTLSYGARLADAIRAAGGFVHPADADGVNLASILDDGMEINIPDSTLRTQTQDTPLPSDDHTHTTAALEQANASRPEGQATATTDSVAIHSIDLNSADVSTLETIPGIGPRRAAEIVNYRLTHGPFVSVDDVRHVHGIGAKLFSRIQDYLYVSSVHTDKRG